MKRITTSSVDYIEMFKRVPLGQIPNFKAFQEKTSRYLGDVTKYPDADLPKIDWKYYENYINPVDLNALQEMKQKYISFSVPFPKDVEGLIQSLEAQENTVKAEITTFLAQSNCRITEYERLFKYHQEMMPFNEMTMEDFADAFPDFAPDFIKKPTFWPHTPEEQISPNDTITLNDILLTNQILNKTANLSQISIWLGAEKAVQMKL